MHNEINETNHAFAELVGGHTVSLYAGSRGWNNTLDWVKEDLPFAEELDRVTLTDASHQPLGVFGHKAQFRPLGASGFDTAAEVLGTFKDGSPAVTRRSVGKGAVVQCSFHPGLAYLSPALARRPVDRGCSEQSYNHFVPTAFATSARDALLVGAAQRSHAQHPILTSEPLVDATVLVSKHAAVVLLVNWSGRDRHGLVVKLNVSDIQDGLPTWSNATLASGRAVTSKAGPVGPIFTLAALVDGDAIILR